MHLADSYTVISHQIMHLPIIFDDGAVHTVEFWVVPILNHAIILGIPFLHELYPSFDWKNHTITW